MIYKNYFVEELLFWVVTCPDFIVFFDILDFNKLRQSILTFSDNDGSI